MHRIMKKKIKRDFSETYSYDRVTKYNWRLEIVIWFPCDTYMSFLVIKFCIYILCCAFMLAWTKSRKSYCTTPGVGVGVSVGVSKMLKFLRKSFLCDGQGAVRRAILSR